MDDTRFRSDRGGDQPYPAEEDYQDNEVPRARRHGLALVMAIFGLALVGSACAVGYRNIFVGSVSPTLPPIKAINTIASVSEPQAESSGNAHQIGPATTGSSAPWPRVKSNQPRLSARKPLQALRYPGQACLRRRLPVRRYQPERCRAYQGLNVLRLLLVLPRPRSAPAKRLAQTSQRRRTTNIWLRSLSHMPMLIAVRQWALPS